MPITPTTPIIIGAKTADAYWLKSLQINAPGINDIAMVIAVLVPYNSQTGEMFYELEKYVVVDDVLKRAEMDMSLANCCDVIFKEIEKQGKSQGII